MVLAPIRLMILALALLAATTAGAAAPDASHQAVDAVRFQIDNDLFVGGRRDRDYTGGVGITISGDRARSGLLSLDPLLRQLNGWIGDERDSEDYYARQVGLVVFTPASAEIAEVQPDERPFASLVFTSNGRVHLDRDSRGAWTTSLTLGMLGLSASARLHSAVHDLVGSEQPRGYSHQISAGGEPTARYTLARQRLWIAPSRGRLEVKTTVQCSVGFLTEGSASFSLRAGALDSPWWSFAPELTDYISAPVPVENHHRGREQFVFLGGRVKARAYNAFLQGQFRASEVRYRSNEIEALLAEAWIGLVTHLSGSTQVSYSVHYQTSELRQGLAARGSTWGAVQLTYAF